MSHRKSVTENKAVERVGFTVLLASNEEVTGWQQNDRFDSSRLSIQRWAVIIRSHRRANDCDVSQHLQTHPDISIWRINAWEKQDLVA